MSRLNENTTIPLKVIIPLIIAFCSGTWWLSDKLSQQNTSTRIELLAMRAELREISTKIDNAWSVQSMGLWAAKLQRDNPSLKVPLTREGMASQ